ncbi:MULTISPECIES: Fe-S cluster assembly protein NifU [Nitrincola]|uniref:Nitrogen fixation protein NifU n=1 Tax=Nitrincola iocasae TaxID=2614693 RepID=A0A5J6L989_9GAMM|nr:Fe-S cluster assembly protein NifU [Nitrincola iocasae]QEW05083.1 Fe-S cluster assembly protein NifU [Nitrincola iocasae]
MWNYSEKVQEHFFNPRNAGELEGANGIGDVGSLSCGDALRLMINVDPETEVILDARFQTFGCGSAIASSSALTEIIKGKTLDEALQVSNQEIADFLDGLPPEKMHCSVMGREALQAAVANYRGEVWSDDHEEGALICKCFAVDAVLIEETIRANNLTTVQDVSFYTKAGGGCSACHEGIEEILNKVLAETGQSFQADVARVQADAEKALTQIDMPSVSAPQATDAAASGLSTLQRIRKIEAVIEAVRPQLQRDKGDIELIDVVGKTVYVRLTGACTGCQLASVTLSGIQQQLIESLGEFIQLLPVSKSPVTAGA